MREERIGIVNRACHYLQGGRRDRREEVFGGEKREVGEEGEKRDEEDGRRHLESGSAKIKQRRNKDGSALRK